MAEFGSSRFGDSHMWQNVGFNGKRRLHRKYWVRSTISLGIPFHQSLSVSSPMLQARCESGRAGGHISMHDPHSE